MNRDRKYLSLFERIKRTDETGNEYWSSRDLARFLGYQDYRNFGQVISKAQATCLNGGQPVDKHFREAVENIVVGRGATKEITAIYLSRYACYLVIQNADPSKEMVAYGQAYFAFSAVPANADNVLVNDHLSPFEKIKRTNDASNEFWSSRDFSLVLGYSDYRNFEQVINKARTACFNSGHRIDDHFGDVTEMVEVGSGAKRQVKTVFLSRYACYLIVQNADPTKEIVALGQTYFAVQTRRQELADEAIEEERRLLLREEMRRHNVKLADTAKGAGVVEPKDYAIFQNHGYMGLYGGMSAQDIHRNKGLKKSQQILDHMGSTELAANLFRATQTEEKLRREKITGKKKANQTHYEVGAKVRKTIEELGGTMPEELPVADSIKKLETKKRKVLEKKTIIDQITE